MLRIRETLRLRSLIAVISCAVPVIGTGACAESTGPDERTFRPGSAPSPNPAQNPSSVASVSMQNFSFADPSLTIEKGTTVRWQNDGTVPHNTTSEDGIWNSVNLRPGEKFERRFDEAGIFDYQCSLHSGMVGTVVVQ